MHYISMHPHWLIVKWKFINDTFNELTNLPFQLISYFFASSSSFLVEPGLGQNRLICFYRNYELIINC